MGLLDEYLRTAMRERGWNVPRLAEECDVSVGLASKWVSENPRYRVKPSPASCQKIARGLRVDPDYLLTLAGHRVGDSSPSNEMDPRLSAFLAELESGWRAMDEAARDMAERTARALFHVPPVQRRRVTDQPGDLGRPNGDDNQPTLPRRKYQSQSVASQKLAWGFQPM